MRIEDIKAKLQAALTQKRYIHSVNVMVTAVELAVKYGENVENAALAGLLHDCARDIRGEEIFERCNKFNIEVDEIMRMAPELLHGAIGSELARTEYQVGNEAVLTAICYHTTGHSNMSTLDKIIFIADYIEPGRSFQGVEETRIEAFKNIDKAMILALDGTVNHLLIKGKLIHPAAINARNSILAAKPL